MSSGTQVAATSALPPLHPTDSKRRVRAPLTDEQRARRRELHAVKREHERQASAQLAFLKQYGGQMAAAGLALPPLQGLTTTSTIPVSQVISSSATTHSTSTTKTAGVKAESKRKRKPKATESTSAGVPAVSSEPESSVSAIVVASTDTINDSGSSEGKAKKKRRTKKTSVREPVEGEPGVINSAIGAEKLVPMTEAEIEASTRRVQRLPNVVNRIKTVNRPPQNDDENAQRQAIAQRDAESFWATVEVVKQAMSAEGPFAGIQVHVTHDEEGDMIMNFTQKMVVA